MSFESSSRNASQSSHAEKAGGKHVPELKIAIVETAGALEAQARDMAEERLTASKEELKGIKGIFAKIWKHNLAREYYRQCEIAKSKAEILRSKNLYVGEGGLQEEVHAEAMNTVINRFLEDYEEAVHTEAGEERIKIGTEKAEDQKLQEDIRKLVKEYASGKIKDEESFNAERGRILIYTTGLDKEELASAVRHTDNIFEVARQAKKAVELGASLDEIDKGIEIVVGKAKMGVRTEANMNTVDRIVSKMQSSKVGRFVNETTIATGVAVAYCATVGISQRLASSRAFAWGTFGASALVGGAIAGMRESVRVEDERKQHARERAKGKEFAPDADRRSEMEKLIYKTVSARSLLEALSHIPENIAEAEEYHRAMNALAEAETRIQMSDRENIDLISYSDFNAVEKERLELDIARAKVKVALRKSQQDKPSLIPDGQTFDSLYQTLLLDQSKELRGGDEGMEKRDALFKKMKRRKIAGATTKAVLTGVAIGGVVQEASAFLSESRQGVLETAFGMGKTGQTGQPASMTTLEGIRRWMSGEEITERVLLRNVLPGNINVVLPTGIEITSNPSASGEFILTKDGEVLSQKVQFQDGVLTKSSEELLKQHGVNISSSTVHVQETGISQSTPQEFVEKNKDLFSKIHRKFWYDNGTTISDKNELKLHWGGVKGSGIDANGNYTFNIAKMTADGSAFKDTSIDAQKAIQEGKLKLLLSLSKDSQSSVVEVAIDAKGNAIIDPESPIGKTFFKSEGEKLIFIGKFAEIAHEAGLAKDGGKQFEILATHVGTGVENIPNPSPVASDASGIPSSESGTGPEVAPATPSGVDPVPQDPAGFPGGIEQTPHTPDTSPEASKSVPSDIPFTTFEVTDTEPYIEPLFFVPIFGRTPLEKKKNSGADAEKGGPKTKNAAGVFEYGYYGFSNIKREDYEYRMSEGLKHDPDASLDAQKEINEYFTRQERSHMEKVEDLAQQAGPMNSECKLSICIPVAGHQEGKNIYRTLENYLDQTANKEDFEIVLFVNQPDKDRSGNPVVSDNTMSEIQRFMQDHPEMKVSVMNGIIPSEHAQIGYIRKLLNDAVLQRSVGRKGSQLDHIMVSNDADNKGISFEYIQNFIDKFAQHPETDAYMGQLDWDPESYVRNPLLHIGTRLFQYFDIQLRGKDANKIHSSGANFAFRSSIYASVNGYSRDAGLAEDVDLGKAMKAARMGAKEKRAIDYAGARVSRLFTSSRRAEKAIKDGLSPVEQWEAGFSAFDDEVRKIDWESIAGDIDYEKPESIKVLVDNLEYVINRTIKHMVWVENDPEVFRRGLGWLGIKYEIAENSQVKILDASRLIKGLKEYKTGAKEILDRKTKRPKQGTSSGTATPDPEQDSTGQNENGSEEADAEEKARAEKEALEAVFLKEMERAKRGQWELEQSRFYEKYKEYVSHSTETEESKKAKDLLDTNIRALDLLFRTEELLVQNDQWDPRNSAFAVSSFSAVPPTELKRQKILRFQKLASLYEQRETQKREQLLFKKMVDSFGIEAGIIKSGRWNPDRSYFQEVLRDATLSKTAKETAQKMFNDLKNAEALYVLEISQIERQNAFREYEREKEFIRVGRWKRNESYFYAIQRKARFQKFDDVLKHEIKSTLEALDNLEKQSREAREREQRNRNQNQNRNRTESQQRKTPNERAREILGLDENVTYAQARKAYRRYASKHHPDKNGKTPAEKKVGEENLKNLNAVWPKLEEYLKSKEAQKN